SSAKRGGGLHFPLPRHCPPRPVAIVSRCSFPLHMPRLPEIQHARLTAIVDHWLTENYDRPIDLPALSREVGISRFLLCRLYRERTGKTIRLRQREIRVTRAAHLLSDGCRKIGDVARTVGYGGVSHFTQAFVAE